MHANARLHDTIVVTKQQDTVMPDFHSDAATEQDPAGAVFREQIDHLYRQLPRVLSYSVVVVLLLAVILKDELPVTRIVVWVGIMLTILLSRLALYISFLRHREHRPYGDWARRFVVLTATSGLVWGLAGVLLFVPGSLEYQTLVLLVLAGMGAGSAAVLPMYLPAFYAYFPVSMLPSGVMMFLQSDGFHVILGVFDIVFTLGLLTFGRAVGEAFRTSLQLRFENIELVNALRERTAELERANTAKSRFLAAASHDLRQPMHALMLFSELLQQQNSDGATRELVESIQTSVNALARLFDALLDISRLDAGVLVPEISIFPLQEVVERVANDCRPYAEEKGLVLETPECCLHTTSDPTLLERILRNLVTNAIRYTDQGRVVLRCEADSAMLLLTVADTGIGIAAQDQSIIFEEFSQLGNPERDRRKGLGLGLSIVVRLCNLLQHPLSLESSPGAGARFTLRLPLHAAPADCRPTAGTSAGDSPARLDRRVLVVDDDPEVRTGMQALLESWGCRVETVAGAEEAMLAVTRAPDGFDAVISDFRLPDDENGTVLVESLRRRCGADLPALLISGDTEPARLQEARDCGLLLLHKPVAPAQLRAWLGKTPRG
jgi:signal transduction histidine kinase